MALHGWGANAEDLAGLAPYLSLPNCQMVFPDAPFPHPQVRGGRMWYGFPLGYDFRSPPDFDQQADLIESRQILADWLRSLTETYQIPLSRTILAGFSQGGAMTLDLGLQLPLAGLMILSGYLHSPLQPQHPDMPVLVIHGKQDPIVPVALAQITCDQLTQHQISVEYHEFNMGHEIQPAAIQLMQQFCCLHL